MKRLALMFLLIVMVFTPAALFGQTDFPKGPITYIIPFNAGGQSDVEARLQ